MFDAAIAAAADAAPAPVVETPVEIVKGLVLHVDGDYLANYHGFVQDIPLAVAKENAHNQLRLFQRRVGAEKVVVQSTAPGCHKGERYLIATVKPYQAQRSGTKPANVDYMKAYLRDYQGERFVAKTWATREADDGIAACALYAVGRGPGYVAIATADKDMRMLPGVHICWKTPSIVTRVEPGDYDVRGEDGKQYGLKWFWLQMLEGDTADHIPGLELIRQDNPDGSFKRLQPCGPKRAEDVLRHCKTNDEAALAVWREYKRGYFVRPTDAADRFVEQAALLWMRTDREATVLDFLTHEGPSCISRTFCPEIREAADRLANRVSSARKQINPLGG